MADPQVNVKIKAKDEASPAVEKAQGRFRQFGDFLKSRFVITLGDVTRLIRGVTGAIGDVIGAAQKQEDAVRKLDAALEKLGPSAEKVSDSLQKQAASLQDVTRYGDEAIIQAQAFLATLGVQADQIPQATQATVDLAAALGISLEAAARNVGKTVGGFAGELGEVIPELKNLSVEALRSGAGIELLAEKFSGRAQADAKTFSGLMDQLGNAFGDLKESAGEALTQNEGFRESLAKLVTILQSEGLVNAISKTAEVAVKFATAMLSAAEATGKFVSTIAGKVGVLASWTAEMLGMQSATAATTDAAVEAADAVGKLADATEKHTDAIDRANRIEKEFNTALADMRNIAKELGIALEQDVNAQLEKNADRLEKVERAARQGVITWEDYERISAAMKTTNDELAESMVDVSANMDGAATAVDNFTAATERATNAQRGLGDQAQATSQILSSANQSNPLFQGLSGAQYSVTVPVTPGQLQFTGGGYFYQGRKVKVLADGRVEWA